jgi:hypothetical protein
MVYDPSAYYKVLSILSRNKAPNLKSDKDTIDNLLYPAVSQLQTHEQVPLVLELLSESQLSITQRESLTQTFIGQLNDLRDDQRGFSAEMTDGSVIPRLNQLYQTLEKQESGSGQALLRSFRQYLIENAQVGGCGAPWLRKHDQRKNRVLPGVVGAFNERFQSALAAAGLEKISLEDINSETPVVEPVVHLYFEDGESKELLEEAQELRFYDGVTRRPLKDLTSSAWRTQAISYLDKVDDLPTDPFKSAEVFAERLDLYLYLVDLAPQEDLRWVAIEKALAIIENSTEETENPAKWAWYIWTLQNGATHQMNADEFERRPIHDFTERLINSKSRSLHLIGLLELVHLNPFSTGPSMKM